MHEVKRRRSLNRLNRRWLLTVATAGSAAVAGAALAGCSSGPKSAGPSSSSASISSTTPRLGGSIRTYVTTNPDNLDSQKTRSIPAQAVSGHVLSRLVRHRTGPNPNVALSRTVESDLATSVESQDGITWTFRLRSNAKYQNIPPVNGHAVEAEDAKATVVTIPDSNPYIIYGHMDDPNSPFRDVRIRQAISMAIDREAIGKAALNNAYHNNGAIPFAMGKAALPPDRLGNGSKYFSYNLNEAKQLVEASGVGGQVRKLVYPAHAYGPAYETVVQMINPMLNAAGIKTQLVAVDYLREFLNPSTGIAFGHYDVDTLVVAPLFSGSSAPEEYMLSSLTPGFNANHARVNDPDLTKMLTHVMATLNENARLRELQEAQRYVAEKLYYIMGIPSGNQYILVQPRIQNYCYSFLSPQYAGTGGYAKLWLTS